MSNEPKINDLRSAARVAYFAARHLLGAGRYLERLDAELSRTADALQAERRAHAATLLRADAAVGMQLLLTVDREELVASEAKSRGDLDLIRLTIAGASRQQEAPVETIARLMLESETRIIALERLCLELEAMKAELNRVRNGGA